MNWLVYLSGEIHSDWREQIISACTDLDLPVQFVSPVTDHAASDVAGDVLGTEASSFWRDQKSSKVNAIRTRTLLDKCDLAVTRFGDSTSSGTRRLRRAIALPLANPTLRYTTRVLSTP